MSENGGKGLHYFYRDLCNLFIEWATKDPFSIDHSNVLLYQNLLRLLMIKLGDKSKKVLDSNIQIFRSFVQIFRHKVPIDTDVLLKFLNVDQKTHVWQIVGVTIVKICVESEYPLFSENNENTKNEQNLMEKKELSNNHFSGLTIEPLNQQSTFNNTDSRELDNALSSKMFTFTSKLEKQLILLTSVNSKILIKILGELFGKLENTGKMFINFRCSNGDLFGVKLLENFPRTSLKLLILLSEVTLWNNTFYVRQQCLRKTILDVFRNCNKSYIIYALYIFINSLTNLNGSNLSDLHFMISDFFDLLPTILQVNSTYLVSLALNILVRILDFDSESYFLLIYSKIQTMGELIKRYKLKNLEWEFSMFLRSLLEQAIKKDRGSDILSNLFVNCLKFAPSFAEFVGILTDSMFFNKITNLNEFRKIVSCLFSVEDILTSIIAYSVAIMSVQHGGSFLNNFAIPVLNRANSPKVIESLIQSELATKDSTINSSNMIIETNIDKDKKEELTQDNEANRMVFITKVDDIDEEIIEDDFSDSLNPFHTRASDCITPNNVRLNRFSKETNEMMPILLLKKYNQANQLPCQKKGLIEEDGKDDQNLDLCMIVWEHFKSNQQLKYDYFSILAFDMFKSYKNADKLDFINLLVELFMRSKDKNNQDVLAVRSICNLFFKMLKSGKFTISTNEIILQNLNSRGAEEVVLLFNEDFLRRLTREKDLNFGMKNINLHTTFENFWIQNTNQDDIKNESFNLKKIKNEVNLIQSKWKPNLDLSNLMLVNLIDFSETNQNQYLLCPLAKTILSSEQNLVDLSFSEDFSKMLEVLDQISQKPNDELVDKFIACKRRECFKKLQNWNEIVNSIAFDDKKNITLNENDQLNVSNFSQVNKSRQKEFVRALINDSQYSKQFGNVIKKIITCSKSEKTFFENEFPHNICLFWFQKEDLNRAKYFNELHRDKIQTDCQRLSVCSISDLIFEINSSIIVTDTIHFLSNNQYIDDPRVFNKIAKSLSFKKDYFKSYSSDQIFDRFFDLNVLLNGLIKRYNNFDCSELEEVRIFNQIRMSKHFLCKKNIEKARLIMQNFGFCNNISNDFVLYELCKTHLKIENANAKTNFYASGENTLSIINDSLSVMKNPAYKIKLKALILEQNFKNQQFMKTESDFASMFNQLQDIHMSLQAFNLQKVSDLQNQTIQEEPNLYKPFEVITKISKIMLESMINGKKSSIDNFQTIVDMFLENTRKLFYLKDKKSCQHKIPFIFKIMKAFPEVSPNIFENFIERMRSDIFLDWISQIIALGNSCPILSDLFTPVLASLARLHPQIISSHLFFKRHISWIQQVIELSKRHLSPYFTFFNELLFFKDQEVLLLEVLREISSKIEQNDWNLSSSILQIESIVHKSQQNSSCSQVNMEFCVHFIPILMPFIDHLKTRNTSEIIKVLNLLTFEANKRVSIRYAKPTKETAFFSRNLSKFSMIFNCQNQIYYFFEKGQKSLSRLIDMKSSVFVMNSLMRPKKVTFICSDNKNRSILVKYGDDLQEDSRIMTIFNIFNSLLDKCRTEESNDYKLYTYEVLPIEKRFGIIEWIHDSKSIKHIIETELGEEIAKSVAMKQRKEFLGTSAKSITEKHHDLLKKDPEIVISDFDKQMSLFRAGVLKQCLIKQSKSASEFFLKRKNFLGEYALCCLAGYLLGIGDRHLENILLVGDAHVSLIDFGCTFDFGLQLAVPELVPFRLTQIFTELGFPFENQGTFAREFMIAYQAFNVNSDCLNDYIEIYLADPIEKWEDYSKKMNQNVPMEVRNHEALVAWKVGQFNLKINCHDPRVVYLREIEKTCHRSKDYLPCLTKIMRSSVSDVGGESFGVMKTTQMLIEMSTNKNILGRMWTGWLPFV